MSTCTRKVLMTLAETNTPHELVTLDFAKGEHKQPAHLARQPFGQVPALEDGAFAMFESRAMCRYINEKAGGTLVPKTLEGRAAMEQWISVESASFTPHVMKFVYQHVFNRPQDEATLAAATKGLETALTFMEARLAKSAFLAGDAMSLADITFMPYIEYGMMTPAKEIFSRFPHVTTWWNRVSERPTWRKVAGRA